MIHKNKSKRTHNLTNHRIGRLNSIENVRKNIIKTKSSNIEKSINTIIRPQKYTIKTYTHKEISNIEKSVLIYLDNNKEEISKKKKKVFRIKIKRFLLGITDSELINIAD